MANYRLAGSTPKSSTLTASSVGTGNKETGYLMELCIIFIEAYQNFLEAFFRFSFLKH